MNKEILNKIAKIYGTPTYIFESEKFIENYKHLLYAFRDIYPKFEIAYSYKTNYTPKICKIVKELGGFAEVVSDMEYQLAKQLGYENPQIIFNGPFKGAKLEEHLLQGGILNIDNLQEVERVIELSRKYPGCDLNVGLRANIDVEQGFISRFGLDIYNGEFKNAFRALNSNDNINIVGLHCHISRARNLQAWKARTQTMLELADQYFMEPPKYIDLGSGMYGDMDGFLKEQFGGNVPSYSHYAEAVASLFKEHYKYLDYDKMPILFTEPGTTLIAKYIGMLCRVSSLKKIRHKWFAILNCSSENIGEICTMKKLPLTVWGEQKEEFRSIDLVGYTCLEQDVIYKEYAGKISVGDNVFIGNVGAYSIVSKPPFILPNCQVLDLKEDGCIEIIKRQETYDDIFHTFTV